jgi:hypothetical protein
MSDLKDLHYEQCKTYINCQFEVSHDATSDAPGLTLQEVEQRGTHDVEVSARIPFSLIFTGPMEPCLSQQMYRLHNEQTGTLEIFLVPLGPQGEHMRYEAVFT